MRANFNCVVCDCVFDIFSVLKGGAKRHLTCLALSPSKRGTAKEIKAGWRGFRKAGIENPWRHPRGTHDETVAAHAPAMADRDPRSAGHRGCAALHAFYSFRGRAARRAAGWLPTLLVGFVMFAAVVYFLFGLHEAKWRFTSMPELLRIIRASRWCSRSRCWCSITSWSSPNFYGTFFFGKITIALLFRDPDCVSERARASPTAIFAKGERSAAPATSTPFQR